MVSCELKKDKTMSMCIKGNASVVCMELEEILRAYRLYTTKELGVEGACELITEIVRCAMLDEDERDKYADIQISGYSDDERNRLQKYINGLFDERQE